MARNDNERSMFLNGGGVWIQGAGQLPCVSTRLVRKTFWRLRSLNENLNLIWELGYFSVTSVVTRVRARLSGVRIPEGKIYFYLLWRSRLDFGSSEGVFPWG
jgi:hypothetical protein